MDDTAWLAEFIEHRSEQAFARLVDRHIHLVYSAALRQVKNRCLAEDVAQAVFIALSRKAHTVRKESALAPWLLVTTRYIALDALKARSRRQRHERKAAEMAHQSWQAPDEGPWAEMAPHLDAALTSLNPQDRKAITLRYFERMSLKQVAEATGVSVDAARQRVHRATDRLRAFFARSGLEISAAAIGPAIIQHAVHAAPAELAAALNAAVLSAKPAAGGAAALAHRFLSLSRGKVLLMTISKTKLIVGVAVALFLSGGAVVAYQSMTLKSTRTVVIAPQPQINNPIESNWREKFNKTYGLAEGQVVKWVKPPLISERQQFWTAEEGGGSYKLPDQAAMVLSWDGQKARDLVLTVSQTSLSFVMEFGAKVKRWQVDKSVPCDTPYPGDWVVRKGATTEQVMDGIALIVSQELGRPVRFEKRRMVADTIVARGAYRFVPLPGNPDDGKIELVGGKVDEPPPTTERWMTISELLDMVRDMKGLKLVDETGSGTVRIRVGDHHVYSDPDLLMRNIAAQTSIRLDHEPREAEVWCMSERPSTQPTSASFVWSTR